MKSVMILIVAAIIIIMVVINGFQYNLERAKINKSQKSNVKKYQKDNNLSDSELKLFREVMGVAKDQIIEIDYLVGKSKKLKKEKIVHKGIKSAQEVFMNLMEHPDELTLFNDFLYVKLPGALSALKSFSSIESSDIMTAEINKSLNKITDNIRTIFESIIDDYEVAVYDDMDEIDTTKRMVEKKS